MDQGAISTFKAYYLRTTLKGIADAIQVSDNVMLRPLEVIHHERDLQHFSGMK
jgi:hypothetical protein